MIMAVPIIVLVLVTVLVLAFLAALVRSSAFKGAVGERQVRQFLRSKLDPRDFRVLNDVTLQVAKGTTQIDHVVLSRYGIFVLETKHLSGWLFGQAGDRFWTRTRGRSKVRMPNPLRQNEAHIRALEEVTRLPREVLQPAVVLTGLAKFKTSKPEGVFSLVELLRWIRSRPAELLSRERLARAAEAIEAARLAPGAATDRAHLASLGVRGAGVVVSRMARTMAFSVLGSLALKVVGLGLMVGLGFLAYLLIQNAIDEVRSLVDPGMRTESAQRVETAQSSAGVRRVAEPSIPSQAPAQSNPEMPAKAEADPLPGNLRCAYSEDSDRCVCHDERALRVDVPHEACKRRAAGRQ